MVSIFHKSSHVNLPGCKIAQIERFGFGFTWNIRKRPSYCNLGQLSFPHKPKAKTHKTKLVIRFCSQAHTINVGQKQY